METKRSRRYSKPRLRDLGQMSHVTQKSGTGSDGLGQDPKGQP